jgi:acid phosphatase family membrane protein YuiD
LFLYFVYQLAKCLKHIIRQPRPEKLDSVIIENTDNSLPASTSSTTFNNSSANQFADPVSSSSTSTPESTTSLYSNNTESDTIKETPTLALAPTTTLQQEQVNSQRIRRQKRRRFYARQDYGMPSSHAQLVAFFVCYISLQLILMEPEVSAGQWFLIILLQLYAWSAVWSRIQLGRHTISQVLVGAVVGAIYGIMWFTIWWWKVEEMIQHWQWMDRYGVIQVRKVWKQLEMNEAVAIGRADGRMYLREDQDFHLDARLIRI